MSPDSKTTLVLASASPRRRRLIEWLGLDHTAISTNVDETLDRSLHDEPHEFATALAVRKAKAASVLLDSKSESSTVVVGFDTIVISDGEILGKPSDRADARRMLRRLSARTHSVVTGVALHCPAEETFHTFAVSTPVLMQDLDASTIDRWLESDEALGCAGAYNIEHHLASVEIDQCFQNVAGLPLCHLYQAMSRPDGACGTPLGPSSPVGRCDASRGVKCKLGPKLTR